MKNTQTWSVLNIVAAAFALTMNGLAIGLPLFGRTTGDLSDLYPNLFVPAGLTFSIWSVIYLLLIAFLVFQFTTKDKQGLIDATSPWLFINLFMNGAWIVAWHATEVLLSVGIMLMLLLTLIQLNIKLYERKDKAPKSEFWLARVFVSVYLGWISVATIANVTALLVNSGFSGANFEVPLTILMILIATVLGFIFIFRRGEIAYGAVIIWALVGILIKRLGIPDSPESMIPVLYGCIGLLGITAIFRIVKPVAK